MGKILEVRNLVKKYDSLEAVKGISFDVEEGEFFAFLGPNGAGKSTTINILCTLLDANEGEVTVDGNVLGKEDKAIRSKIGVVFQDNMLDKRLTVRQNLDIRGSFYGLSNSEIKDKINDIVNLLSMSDFIDQRYGTLSGGQRRRADIARALINTPKILFLDEPTTGLDPKTRQEVWQIVERIQEEKNITIFLTTHYMEETSVADKVVIINEGEIVATGSPEQLKLAHSHDVLRIVPKSNELFSALDKISVDYKKLVDVVKIKITNSIEALDILNKVINHVEAFEVIRGSMDDVFINITGTKLEG